MRLRCFSSTDFSKPLCGGLLRRGGGLAIQHFGSLTGSQRDQRGGQSGSSDIDCQVLAGGRLGLPTDTEVPRMMWSGLSVKLFPHSVLSATLTSWAGTQQTHVKRY